MPSLSKQSRIYLSVNENKNVTFHQYISLSISYAFYFSSRIELCSYSGYKIYPGHGKKMVKADGRVFTLIFSIHVFIDVLLTLYLGLGSPAIPYR